MKKLCFMSFGFVIGFSFSNICIEITKFSHNFSTRSLTVLTICVIVRIEQREGESYYSWIRNALNCAFCENMIQE